LKLATTITSESHGNELEVVHQKLKVQQPFLIKRKGLILLDDNARPRVAITTVQKLHQLGNRSSTLSQYSPDSSPTNFLTQKRFWETGGY
ncbi:Histone-lysine N-methyltransferase SETMAR, partial [Habropoda laboriosa]